MNQKMSGSGGVDIGLRLRMRSEERRIHSQHQRLDALCQDVCARLGEHTVRDACQEFAPFLAALDAHMKIEEEIYFPAFHGLGADFADDLAGLLVEHEEFRGETAAIHGLLTSGDVPMARRSLDQLARRMAEHERVEEDLMTRVSGAEGPDPDLSSRD